MERALLLLLMEDLGIHGLPRVLQYVSEICLLTRFRWGDPAVVVPQVGQSFLT